jgi:hypothetical protein
MNLFVGIVTCNKNLSKIDYLRKTWVKKLISNNINYKFFVGRGSTSILPDDVVALDVEDDYESLKQKTIGIIDYAIKNYNFDYLLKVDDDTFIDVDNLIKIDFNNKDYIGWFSCLKTHKRLLKNYIDYMTKRKLRKNLDHSYIDKINFDLTYAIGGYYLLNKRIAPLVLQTLSNNSLCNEILQEDISTGYACNLINASTMDFYKKINWYQVSNNNTFYHPINFMLMQELSDSKDFEERKKILEANIILNNYYRFRLQ